MTLTPTIQCGALAAYIVLGRGLVRWQSPARDAWFGLLTLTAMFVLFFSKGSAWLYFPLYVGLVAFQYLTLRWWGERADGRAWLAFLTPILFLVLLRYIPPAWVAHYVPALRHKLATQPKWTWGAQFIGLSYLAFRTSSLALEVRNGLVKRPGFWDYLGFAFFVPALSVGPITPYSTYRRGFSNADRPAIPVGQALLRMLVGLVKFTFLASLLQQLGYDYLLRDGHRHGWGDVVIAILAYYPFLYCNFSGYCDMAIGAAGLMGIPLLENFDNPFAARNMKELWNRWHITLSLWMRDYVFSPLSKALVRVMGPSRVNHAIALTITIVFLLVGVWHGLGWNFVLFGAVNALGVAANHYYTVFLKKRLGKERFAAYNKNRAIQALATVGTYCFFSISLAFFANDLKTLKEILSIIH